MSIMILVIMIIVIIVLFGLILGGQYLLKSSDGLELFSMIAYAILVIVSAYSLSNDIIKSNDIEELTIVVFIVTGIQTIKEIKYFCKKRNVEKE